MSVIVKIICEACRFSLYGDVSSDGGFTLASPPASAHVSCLDFSLCTVLDALLAVLGFYKAATIFHSGFCPNQITGFRSY